VQSGKEMMAAGLDPLEKFSVKVSDAGFPVIVLIALVKDQI
jgi:hypothetical protein